MPNSTTNPPVEIRIKPQGLATWQPATATSGTNVTVAANTTLYYAGILVPGSTYVTGITFLAGQTSTNGTVKASLHSADGTLLGVSAAVATPTASTTLALPLTTGVQVTGPTHVLVGLTFSSTSDKLQAIPAYCSTGLPAGSVTLSVASTPATFTPSSTLFTADKGPVAFLY